MSTTRLAVLFGGVTVEHEVSVITGLQLIKNVDRSRYEVIPVYIDKAGQWWTGQQLLDIEYFKTIDLFKPTGLEAFSLSLNRDANEIDVAILCFHGGYGEAGNVQGALELAGIPYQGPGVTSSALCFDKIFLRQVLAAEHIPQTPYAWFTAQEWQSDRQAVLTKLTSLGLPVFVKPANGGSTIGIEKVKTAEELIASIERVLQFDERVLVEAEIKDCIEINVSVLGLEGQVRASVPEQPIKADEFLSYADKYERGGGKKSGMASATRRIPAPISSSLTTKLQDLAKHIFHVLDCSGVIRIDFFVDPSEERIYVVEPNTIPGSMSYYLWEATGVKYSELVDELVKIAQEKHARKQKLTMSFESNILKKKSSI
jgi:D-alanine-D-alanine ligase